MSKDDIMRVATEERYKVRLECTNGKTYIGVAVSFVDANDEEDGAPSVVVLTDGGYFGFGGNDIKGIEILDNDSESDSKEDEDGKA